MPEPLSIVAAALSIAANAFKLGKETYTIIQGIKQAPTHISRLSNDVRSLYTILGTIQTILDDEMSRSSPNELIIRLLADFEEVVRNTAQVFFDIQSILSPFIRGEIKRSIWNGFKWDNFRKDDISVLQNALQSHKLTLNIAYQSLTFFTTSSISRTVAQIQDDLKRLERHIDDKERQEAREVPQSNPSDEEEREPWQSSNRFSVASYNIPLRRFMTSAGSIISSSGESRTVSTIMSAGTEGFAEEAALTDPNLGDGDRGVEQPMPEDQLVTAMHSMSYPETVPPDGERGNDGRVDAVPFGERPLAGHSTEYQQQQDQTSDMMPGVPQVNSSSGLTASTESPSHTTDDEKPTQRAQVSRNSPVDCTEMKKLVDELRANIKEWRGLLLENMGNLLLHHPGVMAIDPRNHEKKFALYLFERVFFFVKVHPLGWKLRGRIFLTSIVEVSAPFYFSDDSSKKTWLRFVYVADETERSSVLIKFAAQSTMAEWETEILKAKEGFRSQRRYGAIAARFMGPSRLRPPLPVLTPASH